mmetsp:Transcript_29085/g.74676  ORF Transcript_29085/g.74676 Transcript_29085/m.74676 type:complete len:101 (+) Transcript_29085:1098-1400(+)
MRLPWVVRRTNSFSVILYGSAAPTIPPLLFSVHFSKLFQHCMYGHPPSVPLSPSRSLLSSLLSPFTTCAVLVQRCTTHKLQVLHSKQRVGRSGGSLVLRK